MRRVLLALAVLLLLLFLFLNRSQPKPQPIPQRPTGELATLRDPSTLPPGTPDPTPAPPPSPGALDTNPEPPPPEPKITLTATVKDAAGHPVKDATVLVIPHEVYRGGGGFGKLVLPPLPLYTGRTDAEGQVVFRHPKEYLDGVHLFAFTPGQADGAISKALYLRTKGAHRAELTIGRSRPVRGRVEDADGRRIEDAKVALIVCDVYTSWTSSIGPYGFRLDPVRLENGEFEFPPVPESKRMVLAMVSAKAEGYLPAQFEFPFRDERSGEVVVRMLRPVRVTGRIVTAAGRPFTGATVLRFPNHPLDSDARIETGEDGRFTFESMPEDGAVVSVSTPAGIPFRVPVGRVIGNEKDLGDLVVGTGGTIEGIVVDDDGVPLPGQGVNLYLEGSPESGRSTTTGHDGRFAVADLGAGDHKLLVWESGMPQGWAGRKGRVAGVKSGAKDVKIVLTGAMLIRVEVKFPPGQEPGADPAYVHVHFDRVGTPDEPFMQEIWDRGRYSFRIRMRKPGTFTLSVTMGGYHQAREQVEVDPARETAVTVTLVRQ